jgi:hypothetical protein
MSETNDNQEFIKKPYTEEQLQKKIEGLRNDVTSKVTKWADRIQVSMAVKPHVVRYEGEVWEENGKKWTLKDGIRQNITALDSARMPWWCPKCKIPMNHRHDRQFYNRKGMCYNCTIEWEGALRLSGEWEAYEKRTVRENEKSFLRDEIAKKIDYMRTFKEPQIHFEDGRWEVLASKDHFTDTFKSMEDDIEFMLRRLEVITQEELHETETHENSTSTTNSH